jgi:hypothetical protein
MKSCSTSGARKSGFRLSFESVESGCGDRPYFAVKLMVSVEFFNDILKSILTNGQPFISSDAGVFNTPKMFLFIFLKFSMKIYIS